MRVDSCDRPELFAFLARRGRLICGRTIFLLGETSEPRPSGHLDMVGTNVAAWLVEPLRFTAGSTATVGRRGRRTQLILQRPRVRDQRPEDLDRDYSANCRNQRCRIDVVASRIAEGLSAEGNASTRL